MREHSAESHSEHHGIVGGDGGVTSHEGTAVFTVNLGDEVVAGGEEDAVELMALGNRVHYGGTIHNCGERRGQVRCGDNREVVHVGVAGEGGGVKSPHQGAGVVPGIAFTHDGRVRGAAARLVVVLAVTAANGNAVVCTRCTVRLASVPIDVVVVGNDL